MNSSDEFQLPEELSFSYGYGQYEQGSIVFEGLIVLSQHRIFLKGENGDIPQTYVPLEKIHRVRHHWRRGVELDVRLSQIANYTANIKGDRRLEKDLIKDLVQRRNLKRKFLRAEWVDLNF